MVWKAKNALLILIVCRSSCGQHTLHDAGRCKAKNNDNNANSYLSSNGYSGGRDINRMLDVPCIKGNGVPNGDIRKIHFQCSRDQLPLTKIMKQATIRRLALPKFKRFMLKSF